MSHVIVLSGISGSGKSTYANTFETACIVSADHYFTDPAGRYKFDPTRLGDAHAACFASFLRFLSEGAPLIVVDNTNLSVEEISPYMLGAAALGATAEIRTIRATVDNGRRNVHGVPDSTLISQASRLANRKLPSYWKLSDL